MRRTSVRSAIFASLFLSFAGAPTGQDLRTPEEVVQHHWQAFRNHDLEAVLSDYAEDAVFIAPNQTVQGKAALGQMFAKYFSTPATTSFEVNITADGEVGYEHWVSNAGKPGALQGTDAFVVRHGKILFHAVVGVHAVGAQP
jgi:ketosteroid isomerase-like protein